MNELEGTGGIKKKIIKPSIISAKHKITDQYEKALILSLAYNIAAKKHLKIQLISIIVGSISFFLTLIFVALSFIVFDFLFIWIIFGVIFILIGLFIFLYGFQIHKPKTIKSITKMYIANYLVPYSKDNSDLEKKCLIFDGYDLISTDTFSDNALPITLINNILERLKNQPINFKNEVKLRIELKKMLKLIEKKPLRNFDIPIFSNEHIYKDAILDSLKYSIETSEKIDEIRLNFSMEDTLGYTQKIEEVEKRIDQIPHMNEINIKIEEITFSFISNLESIISLIEEYCNKVKYDLKDHFFRGLNPYQNPDEDSSYGYGVMDTKYHIKVGLGNDNNGPVGIFQRVINQFDKRLQKQIHNLHKNQKRKINERKESIDQEKRMVELNYRMMINNKKDELSNLKTIESNALNQHHHFLALFKQSFNQNYRNQASYWESEYINANKQVNLKKKEIKNFNGNKKQDIEVINNRYDSYVKSVSEEVTEDILDIKISINELINFRNNQINMILKIIDELLPQELEQKIAPLNDRKKIIENILEKVNITLRKTKLSIRKMNKIIQTKKVNYNLQYPTKLFIPVWMISYDDGNSKDKFEFISPLIISNKNDNDISPFKIELPLSPLSKSLDQYINNIHMSNLFNIPSSQSILDVLDPNISYEIDSLVHNEFINPRIGENIKKYYGLVEVGE